MNCSSPVRSAGSDCLPKATLPSPRTWSQAPQRRKPHTCRLSWSSETVASSFGGGPPKNDDALASAGISWLAARLRRAPWGLPQAACRSAYRRPAGFKLLPARRCSSSPMTRSQVSSKAIGVSLALRGVALESAPGDSKPAGPVRPQEAHGPRARVPVSQTRSLRLAAFTQQPAKGQASRIAFPSASLLK